MDRSKRIKLNILLILLTALFALFGVFFRTPKIEVAIAETVVSVYENGSRLKADKGASYQWYIASEENGEYQQITGANTQYYDVRAEDEGKYIKAKIGGVESQNAIGPIGKLYAFDLARGNVTLGSSISGYDKDGNAINGSHVASNIYVIQQSNNAQSTTNGVRINGSSTYKVTLDGINIYHNYGTRGPSDSRVTAQSSYNSCIDIPAKNKSIKVSLYVKGENSLRGIHYTGNSQTSSLKITDINGDGETSGYLYVPKKVLANEIDEFMRLNTNFNHWNSGIGGDDDNQDVDNLTIAGANLQVLTTYGDNCTAIGGGGNGKGNVTVTGGNVYAACNGTGTAIGGGIGWISYGGTATVNITGGKVYAKNYGNQKNGDLTVGGVAIGGGSSFSSTGTSATVNISGGTVEAYGTFGNGIGGGNSSSNTGGTATVNITGGNVTASSIGGGNSQKGTAGSANVTVKGTANVTLLNGIGGGDSASGRGGDATITVYGGFMRCATTIGGGNGGGNSNGGNATITVNGGELTSKAIGGGLGAGSGTGGTANVKVTGGKMVATTIGGGKGGVSGGLGNATANISGGEITGQFVMAQGAQPCSFTMSGGTLYGVDTSSEEYTYKNGGAVYIEDKNGRVEISGGTIKNGKAENGGAIYLGGGNVYISGGSIENNVAKENGGGVYVGDGNFYMEGGSLSDNVATNGMGGGAYVHGTDNINVSVRSGRVENNRAKEKGGAIAVVGNGNTKDLRITIGVKEKHFNEDGDRVECNHRENGAVDQWDCPQVSGNQAIGDGSEGGAFYITGSLETYFNVYCLIEENNIADGGDSKSDFMKVDGGSILISSVQHDENCDHEESNEEECPVTNYGNVVVNGSFHVAGGRVSLKGNLSAPLLKGPITVDSETGGDFEDSREESSEFHKVQYFEDFQDSGRYTVYQVKDGDTYTIAGAMYGNLGYAFDGWQTKDGEGKPLAQYSVGQEVIIEANLLLYAKWNANVYFVIFSANVPPETSYEGTMEQAQYAYNKEEKLPKNEYFRKGYVFKGWALSATATEAKYEDQQGVLNLADSAGEEVTLYAIWIECVHGTLVYKAEGNVITRSCACLAFQETATLTANGGVYDGNEHPATIVYSNGEWGALVSEIKYSYKAYGSNDSSDEVMQVINAGEYVARITCQDVTARISFEIEKATQLAPKKPTYETTSVDGGFYNHIVVSPADGEEIEEWQTYEYRIGYLGGNESEITYMGISTDNAFDLEIALTNYFVYIRFKETQNYKASEFTQADSVYFFQGNNISLTVVWGDGLNGTAREATQDDDFTGILIDGVLQAGYYRLSTYGVVADKSVLGTVACAVDGLQIQLTNIPNEAMLKVVIEGARRGVTVSSQITANETFGTVTGTNTNIAHDSAYTVYFSVQNYVGYEELALRFDKDLPKDTTLLLIDKSTATHTYWYCRLQSEKREISLNDFKSMQTGDSFTGAQETFNYQFVIDFSACETAGLLNGNLKTYLTAEQDGSEMQTPDFPENGCTAKLNEVLFSIEIAENANDGTVNELSVAYAKAEEETTLSKWENRQATLVLTAQSGIELPLDASIEFVENNRTTTYYRTGSGDFVLPLTSKENSIAHVKLTLKSGLFPDSGATYVFTVKLYVSNSAVGKSPMNAEVINEKEMQFTTSAPAQISLKIVEGERRLPLEGTLHVRVEGSIPQGFELSADVMKKEDRTGVYSSTGLKPSVATGQGLSVSFAGLRMEKGSYCLMLTVKDTASGLIHVRVPYYFILYGNG